MIYLDVTRASGSTFHMGVDRTVRGIYHYFAEHRPDEVTPLRWDFVRKRYSTLSSREMKALNNTLNPPGVSRVYKMATYVRDAWLDFWTRHQRGIKANPFLKDDDYLFIPDLCWDARVHSWEQLPSWPGKKLAVLHDTMPLNLSGQPHSNDKLFQEYVCALGHLDRVICISQEVRQDLLRYWRQFGVAPKPITVLHWPVPFTKPRPDNPPNQQARHIIYVSRLKLRKNHMVLLEACERLWDQGEKFSLDFIGLAEGVMDTLKVLNRVKLLASKGYAVRWRKYVSEQELLAAYCDCSFTAFPSRMEGFGLPIVESLWYRRPVICGRNGAIGEVAADGGCYQVDQNSAEELAEAIRQLLNDKKVYDRLYQEADRRVFKTWKDYGRSLEETFLL